VAQSAQSGWSAERGMTMKKFRNSILAAMMAAMAVLIAAPGAGHPDTASVHGHVNDATGTPVG
jgi:hypothetical protein